MPVRLCPKLDYLYEVVLSEQAEVNNSNGFDSVHAKNEELECGGSVETIPGRLFLSPQMIIKKSQWHSEP